MSDYRMIGVAKDADSDFDVIMATHPAAPGTFIVYAFPDGSQSMTPVVLWGVLENGVAVPITTSGVWDGVTNNNNFVLHPTGHCSTYDNCWDTLQEAVEEVGKAEK